MCGLVGFFGGAASHGEAGDEAMLKRMADTIVHRGPDDAGYWCDTEQRIGLRHRRLSIVDLSSAGHQPMQSASGRYVIVFNGEIYNHPLLRREFENKRALNPAFSQRERESTFWRGHSDTETLLACFDAWGIQATVERAIGMFAFAVWDRQAGTLTLARDRIGKH